jgi:glycosyltransferase involved in cell wall biosynthesis
MISRRAIDIRLLGKKRTGDEAVFFNLTKELLALDQEHEYWLLTDEKDPSVLLQLQNRLGCVDQKNVRIVSLSGKNRFLWNLVTLPWFLFRHRVDAYHTQYILPLCIPKRTRVLLHIHDVSFKAYPELIGWKDRFFLALLIPRSLRRASRILVPSQFTKDEIQRYYGTAEEKIVVIPNAVSDVFLVTSVGETALQEKYSLPKRFILFVGTLQPRKNIPLLIRAFAEVTKQISDIELVIVGNRQGHHFDSTIDSVIEELDLSMKVHFPGYIAEEDLPGVMRCASLFVFPSFYEGFGIPLLEAMSQNVPVACSDISCLREVAGDAAQYFDPMSVASCQEKLYTLLIQKELRESVVALGKSRSSFFSWKKSATLLSRVYETLA